MSFNGEMESWMVEVMGPENMAYCKTCHKLVIRGNYCDCGENIAWHNYCLEKQLARGWMSSLNIIQKEI